MDDKQKKQRMDHTLARLTPSGVDGKLARIFGAAYSLLPADVQGEVADAVLSHTKSRHHEEIRDICAEAEIPLKERSVKPSRTSGSQIVGSA